MQFPVEFNPEDPAPNGQVWRNAGDLCAALTSCGALSGPTTGCKPQHGQHEKRDDPKVPHDDRVLDGVLLLRIALPANSVRVAAPQYITINSFYFRFIERGSESRDGAGGFRPSLDHGYLDSCLLQRRQIGFGNAAVCDQMMHG